MNQLRNLPIGVQSFEKLRKQGYLYIDKTQYIRKLLCGQVYFLSRPRRFGKSLFLSTLAAYFEGQKDLFHGLSLERAEPELAVAEGREAWIKYPVLYLDLNTAEYNNLEDLQELLRIHISQWEELYGRGENEESIPARFGGIIRRAYKKTGRQAVLLVDEYDKPLLNSLHNPALYKIFRDQLYSIYSNIKSSDKYLRFVFLTGVSRFGKLSIFSGLNNLEDITMDSQYAAICGITTSELQVNFAPEIEEFAQKHKQTEVEILDELKRWYDGYLFAEDGEHVYNPFSILNTLKKKYLDDYWYATGTPTFLVKYLKSTKINLQDLEHDVRMGREGLQVSPLETRDPIPILFQTGYLTIKEKLTSAYRLGFPNEEVRFGFMKNLLVGYYEKVRDSGAEISYFLEEIERGDIDAFMTRLQSIIGGIPYSNVKKEEYREINGEAAVYLVFSLMGQYTQTEVHCPGGRADAVVHTASTIYVFEFKMEGSGTPEEALAQIEARGYTARYRSSGKKVVCVGVTFSATTRNIGAWEVKEL